MNLRSFMLVFILSLAAASAAPQATRPVTRQPLPAGLIVFNANGSGNHEICTMQPDGSGRATLTHDPRYDSWWPRVSPDRKTILFYRNAASKRKEDYKKTALWMMAADGSGVTELRPAGLDGWAMQGHAEWSPDGRHLVMFGGPKGMNPQIYITNELGREAQALTGRPGQNLDPSWSPDGKTVVFVGTPSAFAFPSDYEIYTIAVAGGEAVRHTFDDLRDHDPYFSPDGRQVAWLTQTAGMLAHPPVGSWGIRVARADQADWTAEKAFRWVINDENISSYPAWFPDGARLAFHRLVPGSGQGFGIHTIKLDGGELKALPRPAGEISEYPCVTR